MAFSLNSIKSFCGASRIKSLLPAKSVTSSSEFIRNNKDAKQSPETELLLNMGSKIKIKNLKAKKGVIEAELIKT